MAKGKNNLNTIYISERLQESLRPISHCMLTTITAPMGYGKTTAVNWFLGKCTGSGNTVVIRSSIYSENLSIFWKGIQDAFSFAGLPFLAEYECPSDTASAGFLADVLCHTLAGETAYYIFIDDFHLLTDGRVADFLCMLANRLPQNVHLIVASRDRLIPRAAILRLGSRLHQISAEDLRLNYTELSVYAHKCGTDLNDQEIETLLHSSEGWFSAVYLNLCSYAKNGELADSHSDIYEMFSAAMMDPLPEEQREFLIVMGLADEFTADMALAITKNPRTKVLLQSLTEQNAFVKRLADGRTFRFHHMMKECAERAFSMLDPKKQKMYYDRYGDWYEADSRHLHALSAYYASRNFDALLQVVQNDAGILLSSLRSSDVQKCLEACPVEVLKEHPLAILVLMRSMFNWKQIPKMLELKEILMSSISEHPDMSSEERGNFLGECDLIMSFLMYNDIGKMSQFHRSASAQMSRPAISIQNTGGWTFGSPSVLMMFHRGPGELSKELKEMNECMPHYYKITNGHGKGAERTMSAEAEFMQGHFVDAQIRLEDAYEHIDGSGQISIALCCDFLAQRLSLCTEMKLRYTREERRKALMETHNVTWVNIFDSTCAYYYALTGQIDKIPALFGEHRLSTVNFLAPGKPMMDLIENQVYLAQGEYAKVIGRQEGQLAMCESLHYGLVALHIQIQTAAAYEKLGKRIEARKILQKALDEAQPDGLLMPFVENYRYLQEVYENGFLNDPGDFLLQIREFGKKYEDHLIQIRKEKAYPKCFEVLSERELEIVKLMAEHLSNKEIAERLFLSEGTVKQYINQLYSKLQITGDTRNKRKQLLEMI